jgi:uncharacterized protein YxjI
MEITSKDWECVIEKDVISEVQKKLNQWRHEYDLRIVDTHIIPGTQGLVDRMVVVLWRKRK